jgi:hypothetical protein
MRVRAKEVCFVEDRLRQEGEEFDYRSSAKCRWLQPLEDVAVEEEEEQAPLPEQPQVAVKRGPGRPRKNPQ